MLKNALLLKDVKANTLKEFCVNFADEIKIQ